MENNNTTLHVSLGDLPISKSEVETVLNKSDGITANDGIDSKPVVYEDVDWDFEYQQAKDRVSRWGIHVPDTPKHPLPAGKGLVTSIVELSQFDCTIWARLGKLGYNVKNLKREMKARRMSVRQFLGCNFPRPVLEKLYQMAVYNGCY